MQLEEIFHGLYGIQTKLAVFAPARTRRYDDLIQLAIYRKDNSRLLNHLIKLDKDHHLPEADRVKMQEMALQTKLGLDRAIDEIVFSATILLDQAAMSRHTITEALSSLRVADHKLVTIFDMGLDTKENLFLLLTEYMEVGSLLISLEEEKSPLYHLVEQGYNTLHRFGVTKYGMDGFDIKKELMS